ncbi:group II intron reverse transcriptase/maturase [Cohnella phaseoli]|uniref:Group II intron reverse transcriptase/maturase n=1 Tax=Cohnella phaseoli TaxID=456490 RepID=A0A3D9JRU0_9BACL|nr:group II intron reverse transcriptase/maturase [Cohnella phaseoli]RED76156.1 group II intron reverse transcriptase/maturase [Cohnella phaseoli]
MEQKFNYPDNEAELRLILDQLYEHALTSWAAGTRPRVKGLLEIITADATILTAIHNLKANQGGNTPGTDGQTMKRDILQMDAEQVLPRVKSLLQRYQPQPIRRVYIDKPGKVEKRPLGIPAIIDRIAQECIRMVIEPILEAQFFDHSYGFRPMRDAHMAIGRVADVIHKTGYHWVVEGDISNFFDNVNHSKLINKLWNMGIRDQRVLMIIKAILKSGIKGEIESNELGTAQGGIISPLLANVYLNIMDEWIIREWDRKKTRSQYKRGFSRGKEMMLRDITKGRCKLKPAFLIRYADDWILVTQSKKSAEKWKSRVAKYLNTNLRLKLSEEKTLITNVEKKPIKFVGFNFKVVKGKSKKGFISRIRPNPARLQSKIDEIHRFTRKMRHIPHKDALVHHINVLNSKIRGVIQYYEPATWVNIDLRKFERDLAWAAYLSLKRNHAVRWTPANETHNLLSVHSEYISGIPAIEYLDRKVGVTSLKFCKWKNSKLKNPLETPFTLEGRKLYTERTGNKSTLARADELMSLHYSLVIRSGRKRGRGGNYNFEFYLNRAYAFNRDKGRCRVCGREVHPPDIDIHHIDPNLPIDLVNKVSNLATLHNSCHEYIHNEVELSQLGPKIRSKVLHFREKVKGLFAVELQRSNHDGAPYAVKAARTVRSGGK